MSCDVTLLLGEPQSAKIYLERPRLKVCVEVLAALDQSIAEVPTGFSCWGLLMLIFGPRTFYKLNRLLEGNLTSFEDRFGHIANMSIHRYASLKWGLSGRVTDVWSGLTVGFLGFLSMLIR